MKKIKKLGESIRQLLETAKPQMIQDIETAFGLGEKTWQEGPNFQPNQIHLISMFDIINKYIFEGKLDRTIDKNIVTEEEHPEMKFAMAAFSFGQVKGQKREILMVRHPEIGNFFNTFCAMIHEMIHMYDFHFGPMGQMLNDNLIVGQLNWGHGYHSNPKDSVDAAVFPPKKITDKFPDIKPVKLDGQQLPDNMPDFYHHPGMPMASTAKQYQYPIFKNAMFSDLYLKTGQYGKFALIPKYELSETSMYDVHGRFFKLFAERANYIGFDVTECFEGWRPHKLRQTWENENCKQPTPVDTIAAIIKTDEHFAAEWRDIGNWRIEIT